MSIQKPFRISKINTDNIVYTKIKKNKKKTIIYIKYQDNNKLKNFVFQTPSILSMYSPFKENNYYEIDSSLNFKDKDKGKLFIDFLESIDKKVLYDASINSHEWFDLINKDGNEVLHKSIIREDEECENGVIKLKILKTTDFETILRLNEKNVNIEEIGEDLWCKMILECYAIIITEDLKMSVYIRPIIMSFKDREENNYNYDFIDESDDDGVVKDLFIKSVDTNNENSENKSIVEEFGSTTSSD